MQDPELKDKSLLGGDKALNGSPFSDGLYALGLTEEQVNIYGEFIHGLYVKAVEVHGGQLTRNGFTMLRGAIFAIGTRKQENPEWQQHCASSLREVFNHWDNVGNFKSDFMLFFRNEGETLKEEESSNLKLFWQLYDYFTGIHHHNDTTALHALWQIMHDQSLKPADCFNGEIFIERVKDFFLKIAWIAEISKNHESN